MKLFKRRNSAASDKAAGRIANLILKVQRKFASALGRMSASWKVRQQWIFLYLVCLTFGGLSVIAIVRPFNKNSKAIARPSSIKIPRIIPRDEYSVRITDEEARHVHDFKVKLDSLSKTESGKIKVNGLLSRRPGLMDSLAMVEQMYYSQKPK